MNRRRFVSGTIAGAIGASVLRAAEVPEPTGRALSTPILTTYAPADHRCRLKHIRIANEAIQKCARKHLITNYMPGQVVFDPHRADYEPDEVDDRALAELRGMGAGLIQPWSRWAYSWGKNHLEARNPAGFRRLVAMAHRHGLKLVPYTSTQFFERTDPAFRPEWAWPARYDLVEHDYHLAKCSPASPGWRAHLLPRLVRVLEEYGVDGLYNDLGYERPGEHPENYGPRWAGAEDAIPAFTEDVKQDGALGDLLALIYNEVKRRGGIYKIHKEGADTVYTDTKVYDYLWVGEAIWGGIDFLREKTKRYDPYVIPQRLAKLPADREEETFLNSIPYLQFPILGHGQAGEQGNAFRAAWARWLAAYLPMVEEGTWAYLDITESNLLVEPPKKGLVVSAFANRELYLVLGNIKQTEIELATLDDYISLAGQTGRAWKLGPRTLLILKRANV